VILVDTSIWVDHLRGGDHLLAGLLIRGEVLMHPFVTGELALGHIRQRDLIIRAFSKLPQAVAANDREVLQFIDLHALSGTGIGYIDAHLLAAVRLTPGASFWTRDRRLFDIADRLRLTAPAFRVTR
jgi:hypothetical protein